MNRLALLFAALFVGTVFAANWALERWGIVELPLTGLDAPAGVYFVGLAFVLRDLVQRLGSKALVVVAILIGAGASYFVSPAFATASAVAFLASELADFAVYTPLARRHFLAGVAVSNVVGAVVDSALFLWLADLPVRDLIAGQVVGKLALTVVAIPVLLATRRAWR